MKLPEQQEAFFNFKELCSAVLLKDVSRAMTIFRRQSRAVFSESEGDGLVRIMRIFLTSMNRSIYNYLLFALDVSLHECCFRNCAVMHKCETREQFFRAAEHMIRAYCGQFEYRSACNVHIINAKEYIERNLSGELPLKLVASQIHISPSYLSELFTSCTGKSFSVYVRERRLERARQMLLSTRSSVQNISQTCGFTSSAYFSTAFAKWAGVSPREYRANARAAKSA